jgi:hypothetical protein
MASASPWIAPPNLPVSKRLKETPTDVPPFGKGTIRADGCKVHMPQGPHYLR